MPRAGVLFLCIPLWAHLAYSCIYFEGSDLSRQILVIRKDRDNDYCVLSAETKDGDTVPCKDNVTATRINSTHIRLNTEEELGNSTFFMSYGTNMTGQNAQVYEGDCPNSTVKIQKTAKDGRNRYGLYAAISLVLIISISIYMKYKKDKSQRKGEAFCNGVKVGRHTENTEHVQQNGALQANNTRKGLLEVDAEDGVRQ